MEKIFEALSLLGKENGVSVDTLIEKVKSAISKAVKKSYPDCENININIDEQSKIFEINILKTVVENEPANDNEINIHTARTIDPNAYIGGICAVKIDASKFGRAAAQSAKQSIKTDLRDISRAKLLEKFADKENECISAVIKQIEPKGTATLIYDKTELYLFKNEQIPGEELKEGQNIKVYITGITNKEKKPIIKISRTHRDLVKRLFEIEVPEIYDGVVEIKSISREPGSRTKIAVCSNNPDVEAVGACIGPKSSRILRIVSELHNEKIDVIAYSEKPEEFIAKALAPSKVLNVVIADDGSKLCRAAVPEDQLSLAIGNRGQNAKLAAKLTGYKIDIITYSDKIEKFIANAMTPAASVSSVILAEDGSKSCTVVVPDGKADIASGINGQNVKLAEQLTGYSINIITESQNNSLSGNATE